MHRWKFSAWARSVVRPAPGMSVAKKFACSIMTWAQNIFSVFEWTAGSVELAGGRNKIGLEGRACGPLTGSALKFCPQTPISAIPPNFITSRRESVDMLYTSYYLAKRERGNLGTETEFLKKYRIRSLSPNSPFPPAIGAAVYIWAGMILNSIVCITLRDISSCLHVKSLLNQPFQGGEYYSTTPSCYHDLLCAMTRFEI